MSDVVDEHQLQEVDEPLLMKSPPPMVEIDTITAKSSQRGLRDPIFLLLFLIHLIYIASLAVSYGGVALSNTGAGYWIISPSSSSADEYSETADQRNVNVPGKLVSGFILVLFTSATLSMTWVFFLSKIARFVMNTMILSIVVVSTIAGFALISTAYVSLGLFLLAVAIVTLAVAFVFQARIAFASENLAVASEAIVTIPSTMGYSLLCLLLQVSFVIVWSIAAFGFATNSFQVSKYYQNTMYTLDECTSYKYYSNIVVDGHSLTCSTSPKACFACLCGPQHDVVSATTECFKPRFYWPSFFLLVVSLFWTNAVLANVLHGTTAASVWRWWTRGSCSEVEVARAFKRMTTDSLGSICFGSLLAAVIRSLRAILALLHRTRHAREQRRAQIRHQQYNNNIIADTFLPSATVLNTVSSTTNSFLTTLDHMAEYALQNMLALFDRAIVHFNRYAFCIVGIEGTEYVKASSSAVQLFQSRGLTALLNDELIDTLLFLSCLMIGVISMSITFLYTKSIILSSTYSYLLSLFGFFCGFVMSTVMISTLSSAVTTVYISFAKNPHAFQTSHPELYLRLARAWHELFPRYLASAEVARMEQEFAGPAVSIDTVRGTYNPPALSTETGPTNGKGREERPSSLEMSSMASKAIDRTVSWGTNVWHEHLSPAVHSGAQFFQSIGRPSNATHEQSSSTIIKGSYQSLSATDPDQTEVGTSSLFLGDQATQSQEDFRL